MPLWVSRADLLRYSVPKKESKFRGLHSRAKLADSNSNHRSAQMIRKRSARPRGRPVLARFSKLTNSAVLKLYSTNPGVTFPSSLIEDQL